jgi:hypothetical protein
MDCCTPPGHCPNPRAPPPPPWPPPTPRALPHPSHRPLAAVPLGHAATSSGCRPTSAPPPSLAVACTGLPLALVASPFHWASPLLDCDVWHRLESLVKDPNTAEAKATDARCRVQAPQKLLEEEQSTIADLERKVAVAKGLLSSSSTPSTPATASTDASSDAAIITNLHLQAMMVLNVRQLVNIVLELRPLA